MIRSSDSRRSVSSRSHRSPNRSYRSRSRENHGSHHSSSSKHRKRSPSYRERHDDHKELPRENQIKSERWSNDQYEHYNSHSHHKHRNNFKRLTQEEELLEARRQEREIIGMRACPNIWGKSPLYEGLVLLL